MREVRWERMFPDELEAAFAACPVVYFPYGLCEPHGPQNALGLDALKAHGIACAAARAHGGIVAPPDYWHIHELGGYAVWSYHNVGEVRPWLTALPPWQHFRNVTYHIRAADALGFHAAIFLTGHYGPNWRDLKTLLNLLQPHVGMRLYGLPDLEANNPGFDGDGKARGDHAGKVETSLLWALEPDCVDVSRFPAPDVEGPHFAMGRNARESNRLTGERMVADEVRYLGEKARELLTAYVAAQPERRMLTFEDVERIWEEVVRPKLPEFETMQSLWGEQQAPPETSRWRANWRVPDRMVVLPTSLREPLKMTHAEKILIAVRDLVGTQPHPVFSRDEIRSQAGISREEWESSYSPTFQAMRIDQPGGAPSIAARYKGVFQQVEHGKHTLTEYGRQLLRELP